MNSMKPQQRRINIVQPVDKRHALIINELPASPSIEIKEEPLDAEEEAPREAGGLPESREECAELVNAAPEAVVRRRAAPRRTAPAARRRTMPTLVKCSRCPARLTSDENRRKHEMIHDGAKPIYCDRCDERFTTIDGLKLHVKIHPDGTQLPTSTPIVIKREPLQEEREVLDSVEAMPADARPPVVVQRGTLPPDATVSASPGSQGSSHASRVPASRTRATREAAPATEAPARRTRASRKASAAADAPATRGDPGGSRPAGSEAAAAARGRRAMPTLVKCSRCPARLTSDENRRKHEMIHDGAKPIYCDRCDARFMTLSALKLHVNSHTGERPFQCDDCDKAYADPSVLLRHRQSHHQGVRHVCKTCCKSYMTKAGLFHHRRRHHTPRESWPCPLCDKVFPLKTYMTKHLSTTHAKREPDQMAQCHICFKKFKWHSYLAAHVRTHSGERPYPCRECGRRFSETGHRRIHELTHGSYESRPHVCTVCQKRFVQHGALSRHLRTHTGERPFRCAVCPVTFGDQSALHRHRRMHSAAGRVSGRARARAPREPAQAHVDPDSAAQA